MKKIFICILLPFLVLTAACESNDSGDPAGYVLTLNLDRSETPNGTFVYAKLVASGGSILAPAIYSTSGIFNGGSATLKVNSINEGSYMGFIFIDLDGNADPENPLPDNGDAAVASDGDLIINKDTVISVEEWDILPDRE